MKMYSSGIQMTDFPANPPILGNMNVNQYMEYYNEMMKLTMIQQMIKNEQFKGITYPGMGPQMMSNMIPAADLINLKQKIYQSCLRNMPQQIPQVQLPKRLAPIHNLTEVLLTQQ